MNRLKTIVYLTSLLMLGVSCAKEVPENSDDLEQRYIEAYINTNHPDGITLSASGLYFLSHTNKSSGEKTEPGDMIYARYTCRTMDSTIAETSIDTVAKMLGTHSYRTYYGPKLFSLAEGATLVGLREAFLSMSEGDKVSILLPSKLSTTGLSSARLYSSPMLYDLELLRVVKPDIATFQSDSLKAYQERHSPPAGDSLRKDLYFVKLKTVDADDVESPATGDTVKVRYVGRLLDGFVFDTNIDSVARAEYKKNFDKTATYDALTVMIKEEVSSMDVVQGFGYALKQMKEGEEAVVFFSSDYGYQATSSGQIQPYSMLCFYIKVEHIGKPS
jgi:FKBP-type peptidyl-prolyl cis-trans isomerase